MEALAHAMLSNALVATVLALPPLVLARFGRSPALVHSLWLVVLLKLVTPPLVTIPLPDFARVRQDSDSNAVAQYRETIAGLQFTPTSSAEEMTGSESGITADEWEASDSELIGPTEPSEPRTAEPPAEHGRESVDRLIVRSLARTFPGERRHRRSGLLVFGGRADHRFSAPAARHPARAGRVAEATGRGGGSAEPASAPSIWLAPGRLPPMLWALGGRARLLVPSEFWQVLDQDQQLALLAHELAHLKRKDHWVRWLDLVVAGLYWWHPVLWSAHRRSARRRRAVLRRLGSLGGTWRAQNLCDRLAGGPRVRVGRPDRGCGRGCGRRERPEACFLFEKENEHDRACENFEGAELDRVRRCAWPVCPDSASGPHLGPEAR